MARDKKYYDKLTSMHVNSELQITVTKFAKTHNTHYYAVVDNALREFLIKHNVKVPEKNIMK